jgi:excinuclease UvrABC ATPase subunit
LRNEARIEIPEKRRTADKGTLRIVGGNIFNIKNLNAEVPLGKMVVITGVSGSGKSSFMYEILHKNLQARYERKYRTATILTVLHLLELNIYLVQSYRPISDRTHSTLKYFDLHGLFHPYPGLIRFVRRSSSTRLEIKQILFQCKRRTL